MRADRVEARLTDPSSSPDRDPLHLAAYIGDMLSELAALATKGGLTSLAASLRYAALDAARVEPRSGAVPSASRDQSAGQ